MNNQAIYHIQLQRKVICFMNMSNHWQNEGNLLLYLQTKHMKFLLFQHQDTSIINNSLKKFLDHYLLHKHHKRFILAKKELFQSFQHFHQILNQLNFQLHLTHTLCSSLNHELIKKNLQIFSLVFLNHLNVYNQNYSHVYRNRNILQIYRNTFILIQIWNKHQFQFLIDAKFGYEIGRAHV